MQYNHSLCCQTVKKTKKTLKLVTLFQVYNYVHYTFQINFISGI